MRSSARRVRLAAALALVACALPAHADWRRDYDRGTRAYGREQWSEAEAAFRAALAEEPSPDARKRFQGVRTGVYVPHHYAAMAAWKQGACDRAMALWANAASTAVVGAIPQLEAEQDRGMRDCRLRVATSASPASSAPAAASTAPASAPPAPTGAAAAPPATRPAAPASTASTTNPPAATGTTPPAPPSTAPTATPRPTAPPPAATTASSPPPAKPAPGAGPAPAALVAALDAYLAGNYDAILQLDPARLADGRSRAQAHLLRAAALHRRIELDGGTAFDDARREIRAARAANASLVPDAALFPPRFVALWNSAR